MHLLEWDGPHHAALKEWLSSQGVAVLVETLMEVATNDDAVRVVLRCLAEPVSASRFNEDILRGAIQYLTSVPNPNELPHRQSDRIQHRLNWMLFLLGTVLERGTPVEVTESIELAMARSEVLAEVDLDSEYWSASIRRELFRLHRLGCDRARPDAMAFAIRWARLRRASRLGWFDDFTKSYSDILGSDGLAAYQRAMLETP
jgi:hypothetical protein